jgi:hypothetical protein
MLSRVGKKVKPSIEEKIEELRSAMIEEANKQGCLWHEKVVTISQELDKYLVYYQKSLRLQYVS